MSPRKASSPSAAASAAPAPETDSVIALPGQPEVKVRMYGRRQRGGGPLVLHFHGGAFVSGDLDSGATAARLIADAGAVVVSLAYPLAPEHPFPQAIETGYAAFEWTWKHRAKLAGSGARLFLAGEEAGANLAAAVGLMTRDRGHPPLTGQILLSPMLDPCTGTASLRAAQGDVTECKWAEGWQRYLRCPMDAEHPYAVPAGSRRLAELPPTLLLTSQDDPMRDEAQAYGQRLQAAGVPVHLRVLQPQTGWPETLFEAHCSCPCAGAVQAELRAFFAETAPAAVSAVAPASGAAAAVQPRPG